MNGLKWEKSGNLFGKPSEYRLETGEFNIVVMLNKDCGENDWFMDCFDLRIKMRRLKSDNEFNARREALKIVRDRLQAMIESLP